MEPTVDLTWDSGSHGMPRRNNVDRFLESYHSSSSLVRVVVIVCVLCVTVQNFGQDESDDEIEANETDGATVQETTEDTTTERSDTETEDSMDDEVEHQETDTPTEDATSIDDSADNESPADSEDLEETESAPPDDFKPTEELSEDVAIPFPVDI